MKRISRDIFIIGASAVAVLSASCANQHRVGQVKSCDAGEAAVSIELDKLNTLVVKGHDLHQNLQDSIDDRSLKRALKLMNETDDLERDIGQTTQELIVKWEEYVESCDDEDREDVFRETKVNPVVTRATIITQG